MVTRRSVAGANRLLNWLSTETRERIERNGRSVQLEATKTLYAAHETITHIYFPHTCYVSSIYSTEDGSTSEVGIVGNEGIVGSNIFFGDRSNPHDTLVQGGGTALRVRADVALSEFHDNKELQGAAMKFSRSLFLQVSQTAVCNSQHSLEQRFCRWLLMSLDRSQDDKLEMTDEFIAAMLGVERARINSVVNRLKLKGAISPEVRSRGRLEVISRDVIEQCTCECYRAIDEIVYALPWMQDGLKT